MVDECEEESRQVNDCHLASCGSVWGPWATLSWALLITVVFIGVQALTAGAYVQFNGAGHSEADRRILYEQAMSNGDLLAWATIASALVCSVLTFLLVAFKKGSDLRAYLGLYAFPAKALLKWSLLFIALLLLLDVLTSFLDRPVTPDVMRDIYNATDNKLLLLVAVVLAASVFEELFFRGFLLEGFRRTRLGVAGSVAFTAILWSLVHVQYDVLGIATIFIIGLFFGAVKVSSGSTPLVMCLHAINNGLAFLFLVYMSAP